MAINRKVVYENPEDEILVGKATDISKGIITIIALVSWTGMDVSWKKELDIENVPMDVINEVCDAIISSFDREGLQEFVEEFEEANKEAKEEFMKMMLDA